MIGHYPWLNWSQPLSPGSFFVLNLLPCDSLLLSILLSFFEPIVFVYIHQSMSQQKTGYILQLSLVQFTEGLLNRCGREACRMQRPLTARCGHQPDARGGGEGAVPETRDPEGCLERGMTPTEVHSQSEASPGEVSLLFLPHSRSGQPPWTQSKMKESGGQIRAVDRILLLGFHVDLLLWCHCIYLKKSLK